jgi:hypothetical protein
MYNIHYSKFKCFYWTKVSTKYNKDMSHPRKFCHFNLQTKITKFKINLRHKTIYSIFTTLIFYLYKFCTYTQRLLYLFNLYMYTIEQYFCHFNSIFILV